MDGRTIDPGAVLSTLPGTRFGKQVLNGIGQVAVRNFRKGYVLQDIPDRSTCGYPDFT